MEEDGGSLVTEDNQLSKMAAKTGYDVIICSRRILVFEPQWVRHIGPSSTSMSHLVLPTRAWQVKRSSFLLSIQSAKCSICLAKLNSPKVLSTRRASIPLNTLITLTKDIKIKDWFEQIDYKVTSVNNCFSSLIRLSQPVVEIIKKQNFFPHFSSFELINIKLKIDFHIYSVNLSIKFCLFTFCTSKHTGVSSVYLFFSGHSCVNKTRCDTFISPQFSFYHTLNHKMGLLFT